MTGFLRNSWKHRSHIIMCLPVVLTLWFFHYVPMGGGIVMAFKEFDYSMGIWGSPFNGLENFKFLTASKQVFTTMTFNTIMYYLIFTGIGTLLNVVVAIAIDQFLFKRMAKTMQSIMIIPVFISYAAVQFIVYAFLSSDSGLLNNALGTSVRWYSTASLWPYILTIVRMWKNVGYGSVLYMSVLAGIDSQLYEAAEIDGAGKWQQIWHITIPALLPMVSIMLLLSVGGMMHSDTGLFYQVTRNSGTLYPTTQVIDSYVLNAIFSNSNFGFVAAASLFQSAVGAIMVLISNAAVKKFSPENALF